MAEQNQDRTPTADPAKDNAFFPSPYSLTQYVPAKTDFDGVDHEGEYTGGRWKVLMIGTEERYLMAKEGRFFSTGNHPVEMLLPLKHIADAGFDVEVATVTGAPVKLELWAMPAEDQAVRETFEKFKDQLKNPRKLSEIVENELGEGSDFIGVFIPGGHGAVNDLPESELVQQVLDFAQDHERTVITLCHGPAALLASGVNREESRFKGYEITVFPDALDEGPNIEIGYLPGHLRWLVAEELQKQGLTVLNKDMTGQVHRDRNLLTGDSPLASHALGKLSADTLLEEARRLDS